MKKLTKRWQMLIYACSGMGVNMLNLIVGSYICSAVLVSSFKPEDINKWTFVDRDLVVAGLWAVLVLAAKIIDGIIDIPMASFTDNLKTKFGKRRPAILIGLIPMIIAYLAFLLPVKNEASILNTIFFGVTLCVFYSFYTLTMVTYYATFSEVVDNEEDQRFISNVKSVCDIVYFIFGFALLPIFVNGGLNIKYVALIFLPLVLTMLIPFFLIKEEDNRGDTQKVKTVNLFKSLAYTFKNRSYIIWMVAYSFMTFGSQLFLGGINEFFSNNDLPMAAVMAVAFGPVPFTLIIYNKFVKKRGFAFGFGYTMLIFALGMILMFLSQYLPKDYRIWGAILSALVVSFSIGALFSVAYSIPAYLALEEEQKTGISHSAMYFAVQGLFSGVASGIGTGIVLTKLKGTDIAPTLIHLPFMEGPVSGIKIMTLISAVGCLLAFAVIFILPKNIKELGKEKNK